MVAHRRDDPLAPFQFAVFGVRKQLAFPERAIVSALRVPDGDFRDWPEITGWAAGIATALRSSPNPAGGS